MSAEEQKSDLPIEYRDLLTFLGRTEKYLETVNADPKLVKSLKGLVRFLRSRPDDSVLTIIGTAEFSGQPLKKSKRSDLPSDDVIRELTLDQLLEIAQDREATRSVLERIVKIRFGVTSGGISVLQNRDALVEKLRTLIVNESTHEAITRVAGQRHGKP